MSFDVRGAHENLPAAVYDYAALQNTADATRGPGTALFCSWSGGKDSVLALQRTVSSVRRYRGGGVGLAVFGDIDFDHNRHWAMRASVDCGVEALEPLWKEQWARPTEELSPTGFGARVVAGRDGFLDRKDLGRTRTRELVDEMSARGVDPADERGEYHPVVFDDPPFSYSPVLRAGEQVFRTGTGSRTSESAEPCSS